MQVPFIDLITPHQQLEEELVECFRSALRTARFIGGPEVERFEEEFAGFCQTGYCVGVNSGTDALRFALIAAGIGSGDTVITVPNTFIATTEAISQSGAVPEFVDIDVRSYNLDPERLNEYLSQNCHRHSAGHLTSMRTGNRIKAIIPVHLYGQPADMDPILELAEQYELMVVEDACQAHGAEYFSKSRNRWLKAGSMGQAAAFSFYPGKNLGACGEAGAVTTNSSEIAQRVRILRDHGQASKYFHLCEGYNGRLDAIQAGVLRVKLRHLADWNSQRRTCASFYTELLSKSEGIQLPRESENSRGVYHLYVIRHPDREALLSHLKRENIETGLHYPLPLHLQDAYRKLGYQKGDFPEAEKAAEEILSLPMFPQLSREQQKRIAAAIGSFNGPLSNHVCGEAAQAPS